MPPNNFTLFELYSAKLFELHVSRLNGSSYIYPKPSPAPELEKALIYPIPIGFVCNVNQLFILLWDDCTMFHKGGIHAVKNDYYMLCLTKHIIVV